ncbi:MAG TPA: hypothetical protein VH915_13415 [Pedococcus sp.]|jgi:hypothetical protein
MTADPRAALERLVTALERHLDACAAKSGEDDPLVEAAYDDLADAFEDYDEALLATFGELTPLQVYDEDDDELDDHSDEDGDGGLYAGLDDEDYDSDDEDDESDEDEDEDDLEEQGVRSR